MYLGVFRKIGFFLPWERWLKSTKSRLGGAILFLYGVNALWSTITQIMGFPVHHFPNGKIWFVTSVCTLPDGIRGVRSAIRTGDRKEPYQNSTMNDMSQPGKSRKKKPRKNDTLSLCL